MSELGGDQLRLAQAGPVIGKAGPGLQLRLAEACTSCAALDPTTGVAPIVGANSADELIVALTAPEPTKRYKVNAHFSAAKLSATSGSLTKRIQVRYTVDDVAGDWETIQVNSNDFGEEPNVLLLQAIDVPITLGSALIEAVPENCQLMEVQLAVSATAELYEVPNGPHVWLSLAELT